MIRKTLFQGILLLTAMAGVYYAFSRINWMRTFQVTEMTEAGERKIGDLFWELTRESNTVLEDDSMVYRVDSLIKHICRANRIEPGSIKTHVIQNDEPNAYAMPDGHLVVHSALLNLCENNAELAGVLSHELAHIQKRHVMKKLSNTIGLTVLLSLSTGNSNPTVLKEALKTLSEKAYERDMEKEADLEAVVYMVQADLDPQGFVSILQKFAKSEDALAGHEVFSWIGSHPQTRTRIIYVREQIENYKKSKG